MMRRQGQCRTMITLRRCRGASSRPHGTARCRMQQDQDGFGISRQEDGGQNVPPTRGDSCGCGCARRSRTTLHGRRRRRRGGTVGSHLQRQQGQWQQVRFILGTPHIIVRMIPQRHDGHGHTTAQDARDGLCVSAPRHLHIDIVQRCTVRCVVTERWSGKVQQTVGAQNVGWFVGFIVVVDHVVVVEFGCCCWLLW